MDDDDNNGDTWRDWNQSRIQDMIWWGSIAKFVCATNDAVYTVDYANGRFKIVSVIRRKWSYICVAANNHQLFVLMNDVDNGFNGIEIYSTQFDGARTIDFNTGRIGSFIGGSVSFCVTENLIASICKQKQNYREVFQVTLCDMHMNRLNLIRLGRCDGNVEIRTDGKDRFFITTGRRRFYIIRSDGARQVINLQKDGDCIAVLNDQRVAIGCQRNSIEIVRY
jgi:hypothetical protein